MFEKIAQAAEQVATSVSRRQFLSRFGRSGALLAGGLACYFAFPGEARAGHRPCFSANGQYQCSQNEYCCLGYCVGQHYKCPYP